MRNHNIVSNTVHDCTFAYVQVFFGLPTAAVKKSEKKYTFGHVHKALQSVKSGKLSL